MDFEVRIVDSWPAEEIVSLYKAGGWWTDSEDPASVPDRVSGCFAFAVAVDPSGKAVGMGRALSDGVSDAYIQDVVVLPGFRGLGLGERIVQALVDHCLSNGVSWIVLVAEGGSERFYRGLGFSVMEGHTPMRYVK